MVKHNDNLELYRVRDEMMNKQELLSYNISNCYPIHRHTRNRSNESKFRNELDNKYGFYRDMFDTIHCHLYHLYDMGLRIQNDDKYEFMSNGNFANSHKIVRSKNMEMMQAGINTERYGNNKFDLYSKNEVKGMTIQCQHP